MTADLVPRDARPFRRLYNGRFGSTAALGCSEQDVSIRQVSRQSGESEGQVPPARPLAAKSECSPRRAEASVRY